MSTNEQYNEISLIKACSNGDNKAFKKIYDKHSGIMYSICLRYMTNEDEAKDALQEGFIKVFNSIGKFQFTGSFEGWMRRIMIRESISFLRKKKQLEFSTDDMEVYDEPSNYSDAELDVDEIQQLIDKLPEGYRMVFNMYAIEGYKHSEIAEMLSIAESTSKSQLFKARKLLQYNYHKMNTRIHENK